MTQTQPSSPAARLRAAVLVSTLWWCAPACSDDAAINYSATDVPGAPARNRTVVPLLPEGAAGTNDGAAGTPGLNVGGTAGAPGTGGIGGIGGAPGTGGVAGTSGGTDGLGGLDPTDNVAGTSGSAGTAGTPGLGAAGSNLLP